MVWTGDTVLGEEKESEKMIYKQHLILFSLGDQTSIRRRFNLSPTANVKIYKGVIVGTLTLCYGSLHTQTTSQAWSKVSQYHLLDQSAFARKSTN